MLGECPSLAVSPSIVVDSLRIQLLKRPGNADGPTLVPEVALDLPHHVRGRVGSERHVALEVEAVDRLQQADRADLLDVLQRLAAVGVATCQGLD